MTWVEALPTIGVTLVLGHGLILMAYFVQRRNYRGALDNRVPYSYKGDNSNMASRLKERDDRLGLFPAKVRFGFTHYGDQKAFLKEPSFKYNLILYFLDYINKDYHSMI
uniref:Uncharacterized protein n=1 Tax=Ciona savignyi TaxID=51511 RepID=H2ZJ43_CIOSA